MTITSRDNDKLKLARKLHERRWRDKLGLFLCEGEDLVEAALGAGLEPVEALVDAERPALLERLRTADLVAPGPLAEVSTLAHPPRVVAVFRRDALPRLDLAAPPAVGLALWRVGDPGNVGTLLRALDALGPGFLALSAGCADPTGAQGAPGGCGCDLPRTELCVRRSAGAAGRAGRPGRCPARRARPGGDDDLRPRRGARGPLGRGAGALRRPGDDPAERSRRVAQRRDGGNDRALRGSETRLGQTGPGA